jgi:hypothetical protein
MYNVLVDHDSIHHLALVSGTSWNLLDFGIALNFKIKFSLVAATEYNPCRFEGEVGNKITPAAREFRPNAALKR